VTNRRTAAVLLGLSLALARATPAQDAPLPDYVTRADPSFQWAVKSTTKTPAGTVTEIDLTSQTWQGIVWTHQLAVYEPAELAHPDAALLFVSGGGMDRQVKPSDHAMGFGLAKLCGARVAMLPQVPNQPLLGGRKEDDLITETYVRYLDTKDASWPLLFPMVKSAKRAMDAVQAHAEQGGKPVSRFVVTGASKRGWTTWLAGAMDDRVVAIAPMVIPTLNFRKQIPHQKAYFGRYSEQIEDYVRRGLVEGIDSPDKTALWSMVDPFTYLGRLATKPILQINGTNDRYWTLDSMNLYWDDIRGPKFAVYLPNAGHGLDQNRDYALNGVGALLRHVMSGRPLPKLSWKHADGADGTLTLTVETDGAPKGVTLWVARSDSKDFRESEWKREAAGEGNAVTLTVKRPDSGSIALFGDVAYEVDGMPFHLSTLIRQVDPPAAKAAGE
jgi:PhoPQ-activated pathogenicity-related protein